eukprot:TRINITY_DN8408_c0_g1_i1.p1 TRINITY_DN8408_c0_g1~~TRINITY_DN8408_c0_g1_i1.p1  ORF type:complete len:469 (-),score=58.38 TRINITY_DN8408_c0_g1_i1:54-1274(-)
MAEVTVSAGSSNTWASDAAAIFEREGFVVVRNALPAEAAADVLKVCQETEAEMLRFDPARIGCRDPGRYSFGAASKSGQMLHHKAWRHLLDCEPVLDCLDKILPGGWRFCGGGGDFVRGGTQNYQALHSDIGPARVPACQQVVAPAPKLAVNFAVQDILEEDFGPMRVVRGRRLLTKSAPDQQPPCFPSEPAEMRSSKVCPMPCGSALIRDLRTWHGGTPNVTDRTRFLPNVELVSEQYASHLQAMATNGAVHVKDRSRTLCPNVFATLSTRCRSRCEHLCAESASRIPRGVRPDYAKLQETWKKGEGGVKGKGKGAHKSAGKDGTEKGGRFEKGVSYYGNDRLWRERGYPERTAPYMGKGHAADPRAAEWSGYSYGCNHVTSPQWHYQPEWSSWCTNSSWYSSGW